MCFLYSTIIPSLFTEDCDDAASGVPNPATPTTQTDRATRTSRQRTSDSALGWSAVDQQPPLPQFSEYSGALAAVDESSTPFDVFSLFFPECLIKHIKCETNKYAKVVGDKLRRSNKLKPHSIWSNWVGVKLHEMYIFFAIILHMCLVRKPKVKDYWSTNPFICTPFPGSVMSRNRFTAILSSLHVNDNSTSIPRNQPGHDPMHKLRPFMDHLLQQFPNSFAPSECLTIDEGVCGFRGRVVFRVYIKNKPDKYGIKMFTLCDARTGYVLRIEVYTGKSTQDNSIVGLFQRLLAGYFDKGYTIYMDRYYSSPIVFDFLWEKKTKAVGTCMPNRKELPKETVVAAKLKRDDCVYMRRGHLLCLKWKDTRDVLCLSSAHTMTRTEVTVRSKNGVNVRAKPDVILDYNKNKTGVDRSDQMIAYYPFKRKQLKWWKKLFFHFMMMAATNAFVLYRETRNPAQKKKCHFSIFLQDIGQRLAEKGAIMAQERATRVPSNRLTGRHFPDKIPPTEKKTNPTRVCKVCSDRSKCVTGKAGRKETCWWCPECSVALCLPECFKVFHTKAHYT